MTALDQHALDSLGESLGDKRFARVLAQKYRALLPGRVERLTTALAEQDADTALDAVKSLRVSSVTVGAVELAELATAMEAEIRGGGLSAAQAIARVLPGARQRADDALAAYLSH